LRAAHARDRESGPCSDVLRRFRDTYGQFASILVTDAKGVVVCATARPETYYYGSQSWWRTVVDAPGNAPRASAPVREISGLGAPTQTIYAPVVDPDTGAKLGIGRAIYKTIR
jgi:hypothetical protein